MKSTEKRIILFLFSMLFFIGIAMAQPANNNCVNAILITADSACVTGTSQLVGQTLGSATSDGGAIASSCTAVNSQDLWYKFVAKTSQPTITVSNLGSTAGSYYLKINGMCIDLKTRFQKL